MLYSKIIKDYLTKHLFGSAAEPRELSELKQYFSVYGPINFDFHHEGGLIVAVSKDFKYGSIVTQGKNLEELDKNIKDAILTSFDIPSAYKDQAGLRKVGEGSKEYAVA